MHWWLSGFQGGEIIWGLGSVPGVRPEWRGAKGDDSTDCTAAFNNTFLDLAVSNVLGSPPAYQYEYLSGRR